jgi:ATP-dependent RNA helicase DHX8/PRP22
MLVFFINKSKTYLSFSIRHKLDVLSCGRQTGLVQKAICSGFFRNAAKRDPQEGKISTIEKIQNYISKSI